MGPHGAVVQAWLNAANAPADAAGVCRFYSSAANSHFYTPGAQECQLLKDQEAAERRSTGTVRGWSYEGIAFHIQPPTNGQCPAGTAPFSRVYNNGFTNGEGSNHRFVDDNTLRDLMVDRNWVAEGVVHCAVVKPTGTSANLLQRPRTSRRSPRRGREARSGRPRLRARKRARRPRWNS